MINSTYIKINVDGVYKLYTQILALKKRFPFPFVNDAIHIVMFVNNGKTPITVLALYCFGWCTQYVEKLRN